MKGNLSNDILNNAYQHNLELKPYSFFDMAQRLQAFASSAAFVERDVFSKYLLFLRRDYLIQEICATPQSDYTKALIGIFLVSPFIVKDLVSTKGINIFLARDSARDFVTAQMMNVLGIKKNESYIMYFARNNLKNVYGITTKFACEARSNHLCEQELYRKMSTALDGQSGQQMFDTLLSVMQEAVDAAHEGRITKDWRAHLRSYARSLWSRCKGIAKDKFEGFPTTAQIEKARHMDIDS